MPEARRDQRLKIFHKVTLVIGGSQRASHLLDVSRSGARAHCTIPPEVGDRIYLLRDCLAKSAVIAWVTNAQFGLRFLLPLTDAELVALANTG